MRASAQRSSFTCVLVFLPNIWSRPFFLCLGFRAACGEHDVRRVKKQVDTGSVRAQNVLCGSAALAMGGIIRKVCGIAHVVSRRVCRCGLVFFVCVYVVLLLGAFVYVGLRQMRL